MPDHINAGESIEWNTPEEILKPVREFFGGSPTLDPCSNKTSIVNAEVEYRLPEHDGLKEPWRLHRSSRNNVYFNPPFGRCYVRDDRLVVYSAKQWTRGRRLYKDASEHMVRPSPEQITDEEAARFTATSIHDWAKKAAAEYHQNSVQSLGLVPAAVDTATWQQTVFPTATAVCWIKGRIKFLGNVKGPAPMACAIVGWVDDVDRFLGVFSTLGTCRQLGIHAR